ncbi:glycosyltransferase [Arthrobacter koreensis]|uniref:glycosyltransferase n=1 Tax=Arthrobacter koreensis TaxID=199136 RepID=UPI0036DCE46A
MDAIAAASTKADRPHLLGYTPVARVNPYQSLLYRNFFEHGIAVAPVLKPSSFRELLGFSGLAESVSLHLHWNAWMTFGRDEEAEARRMAMGIVGRLEKFRAMGGNLIWTVHNLYPHDAQFIDLELEVQQRIADTANVVHVMSNSTVEAMSGILEIDENKILHVAHPSYHGAYPDYISKDEARVTLGIEPDETVFLLFGAIKPYKGLRRLLDAIDLVSQKNPELRFRLLVAGAADGSVEASEFVRRCLVHPNVLIENSRIASERAQYFLRAADVGLVNYERVLNSGAALLYQTFGLPIVAADVPSLRESVPDGLGLFVQDRTADALAESMVSAANRLLCTTVQERVLEYISEYKPDVISSALAKGLLMRIK